MKYNMIATLLKSVLSKLPLGKHCIGNYIRYLAFCLLQCYHYLTNVQLKKKKFLF